MTRRIPFLLVAAIVAAAAPSFADASGDPPSPAATAPVEAATLPTGLLAPELERRVSRDFLETMDLIYAGDIPEATVRVNALIAAAPQDPRPYLLKARLLREYVSEQDNTRENVKPQIDPILKVLDAARRTSEAILAKDGDSVAGHLYRGWTRMFQGQLHELAFEHWSAGRAAKDGKSDLDKVLAADPDNPDALMITGTYLYFADLLPGVLKIASFILRIPAGDREDGLAYLRRSEAMPSYSQHDARGMRGAILFGFEGDLDGARTLFEGFNERFPDNPRLVEPLAALDLWTPEHLGRGRARVARIVADNEGTSDALARELTARLRLYQAWAEEIEGNPEAARDNLRRLHRENPGRPDWFQPMVDLTLADVSLLLGDADGARALHAEAVERGDASGQMLLAFVLEPGAAAGPDEVARLAALAPVARDIYSGRLEQAGAALEAFPSGDPLVTFYRGEIAMLRGASRDAISAFERLEGADVPDRCRLFRRLARLRRAELHGRLGEWAAAAAAFTPEIDDYDVKDMLRHVMRARQRWFLRNAENPGAAPGRTTSVKSP